VVDVNWALLVPAEELQGEDEEDTTLLRRQYQNAVDFLESHEWCDEVSGGYFGGGVGGIIAVFLLRLTSSEEEVPDYLWVLTGDIPPAYLVTDIISTPHEALITYIELRREWCEAVLEGRSIDDIMPVNVPPKKKWARELESRMGFLEREVLSLMPGAPE